MKAVRKKKASREAQIAAHSLPRPDWARFVVEKGTDRPHRKKKGRGSYTRKQKHKGGDSE
jgi:hypothetical protein